MGAFECVLSRRARRRARSPRAGMGLPLRLRAAQSAWARSASGRGGTPAGPARKQRPVLRMERTCCRRHRASRALSSGGRGRADAAPWSKGSRDQRLFPRSRWFAAGIHFLPKRSQTMTAPHDPNVLPAGLPVPQDDGAALHLAGLRLPSVPLAATDGSTVDLSKLEGRTVVYIYPRTGVPGQPPPDGWDAIPSARGCTPQSCSFRDHFAELKQLGVAQLYGLSTQDSEYQREAVDRLHLPFVVLSDTA